MYINIYRDAERERDIEAQIDTEMGRERDWQSQAGTERYIEKEKDRGINIGIHRESDRETYIDIERYK